MAIGRVLISEPALRDLDGIWDNLAREASPEVADSVIARLYEAIYRAAEAPTIHRPRPEFRDAPRRINVFNYAIFYESLSEGDGIFVWRVFHGARDLPTLVHRPSRSESST